MKILYITLRADYGGGSEHLFQLLNVLEHEQDLELFVACPHDEPYYKRYADMVGFEHMLYVPHRKFSFKYLKNLICFIKKYNIDLIHSHGKGAGLYARLASLMTAKPCVHTFHGVHIDAMGFLSRKLYIFMEKIFGLYATKACISVSPSELEKVKALNFAPEHKLHLVYNGVSMGKNNPVHEPHNVIHISRFDFHKNSTVLIDIAQELQAQNRLQDFKFIILGDGEQRQEIQRKLQDLNLAYSFDFKGFVKDVRAFLQDNTLCVLSTSRWEGLPLALLEAASEGVPSIASNVVGNKDVVDNGENGLLFELNNINDAVHALIKLYDNEKLRVNMGQKAFEKAQNMFSVQKMALETKKIYTKYLK